MQSGSTNPLTVDQINGLNSMFADKMEYEKNMQQLWSLRTFIHNEGEKRNWQPAQLNDCFHTLNDLIDALLPTNGTYYPGYGLSLFPDGKEPDKNPNALICIK